MDATTKGAVGPVAYLTGHYPKASHTFILREIAALEARGVRVLPVSVRRPGGGELIGPEERAEAARTHYLLAGLRLRPWELVTAHVGLILRRPGRWLGAARLALGTARPGVRGMVWQLFYLAEAGVLARYLRRAGARHLHAHFAQGACTVAMLAARLSALPFSFTLHGPSDLLEPVSWRLDAKIARARFVACISYHARAQAMWLSRPDDWPRLCVVRCGVVPARYAQAPPPQRDRLALLFVGRLAAVKGVPVLFEALAALPSGMARLDLIGEGPDRARLEELAAPLGDAVRFLGHRGQGEVAAALAECDALVLPSFAEGVPVVLMEAMASARPVIATPVGGVTELVEDGVSGHLVAPGEAGELARAIAALAAAGPAERRRMGEAGRARVAEAFDVAGAAGALEALFAGQPAAAQERA